MTCIVRGQSRLIRCM